MKGGPAMVTQSILAQVEKGRLAKAVEGYTTNAYNVTVTEQSEAEVRGFVANGDGKQYAVVLTETRAFCSCPDAMYRKAVCKHAVVLALRTIRLCAGFDNSGALTVRTGHCEHGHLSIPHLDRSARMRLSCKYQNVTPPKRRSTPPLHPLRVPPYEREHGLIVIVCSHGEAPPSLRGGCG